jgi:hypothetical protein
MDFKGKYTQSIEKRKVMKMNQKNWTLIAGVLLILIACAIAYFGTLPTEFNL